MTITAEQTQLVNIDHELKSLWDKEQGQGKIRASLFSLILYVQKNERADTYQSLIKSVVSKFPCRVILILVDEKEEYLKTQVSSERVGDTPIYCEIIQVEGGGKFLERIPFIILPHILADLPLYLLWTQDPSKENAILPILEPFANRIIFDSETMGDLHSYTTAVRSLLQRFHCEIGDLNWSAIAGWRKLFSQVFDSPEIFQCLSQCKTIRVHYNRASSNKSHPEVEAIFFQSWLASRLNWKFLSYDASEGSLRFTYRRPVAEVTTILFPQEIPHLKSGTILAIDVDSQYNKAHLSFKRHPETRQVFFQYFDKDKCDLPIVSNLSGAAEGQEIIDEIFYPSGKMHYSEMIDYLAQISWRQP